MFLLQMSGVPGSGKSTVAAHVVDTFGAVAVDYDVIKTAVLDAGFDLAASATAAYETMYALARQMLGQGHPVIMDSPCFWPRILNEGVEIAKAHGARYRYIECQIRDLKLLDERLGRRPRLRSHRRGVHIPPVPPEQCSPKGPGSAPEPKKDDEFASRGRNLREQGRQGNIYQKTHNQGYSQDR